MRQVEAVADVVMTAEAVRELLSAEVAQAATAQAWAAALGLSPSYVSDVLNGRREPGDKMLEVLGLQRVTMYLRAAG